MTVTRVVSLDDAEALARLVSANRDYLAPWSPLQDDAYFTADGQREVLTRQLAAYDRGAMLPLAILDSDGAVAGSINLNSIIRGAFQSASVGYWVSESCAGRGLASAAVADVTGLAFGELGLHRLDAATLLHNTPSQRVLLRNGFRPFAVAESYLKIAGRWQDHILFQLLLSPVGTTPRGAPDGSAILSGAPSPGGAPVPPGDRSCAVSPQAEISPPSPYRDNRGKSEGGDGPPVRAGWPRPASSLAC
jgi:[ribosomal protein S5]-alanine N-acetyltransferase